MKLSRLFGAWCCAGWDGPSAHARVTRDTEAGPAPRTHALGSDGPLQAASTSNTELHASAAGDKAEGALAGACAWCPANPVHPVHVLDAVQHPVQEDKSAVAANLSQMPHGAGPSSAESHSTKQADRPAAAGPGAVPTQSPGCPGSPMPGLKAVNSATASPVGLPKLQLLGHRLAASIHRHELHMDLVDHSPFFMTAIAVDGSKVYQSPLSIRYYGDVYESSDYTPGGEGHGAKLLMHLLRKLFCLEGELLLEEMLRTVLGGREGEEEAESRAWHRTMRVPACCSPDGGDHEQPPACGQAKPRPMVRLPAVPASNTPPASLSNAQQSNGGPPRSANSGVVEAGEHTVSENSSSLMSSFTETAAAVSIAARNAPARMRTLLDRSMSSKLQDSGDQTLSRPASPSISFDYSRAQSLDTRRAGVSAKPRHQHVRSQSHMLLDSMAARQASDVHMRRAGSSVTPEPRDESVKGSDLIRTALAGMVGPQEAQDVQASSARLREGSSPRLDTAMPGLLNLPELTTSNFAECLAELQGETELDFSLKAAATGPGAAPSVLPDPYHGTLTAEGANEQAGDGRYVGEDKGSFSGSQESDSDEREQWHEVFVRTTKDAEGRQLLLIYQNDVTVRTQLETAMAHLTEMQLETLCQIFPRHVIEFLSYGRDVSLPATLGHLARSHEDVCILFMDIVGFTSMSKQVAPDVVMTFLNTLFSIFDDLCATHQVYKVETAGDCYIVSSGLLYQGPEGFSEVVHDHDPEQSIANIFSFAKDMLASSREVLMPHDGSPVVVRIGIHTGPCVSGVVGNKLPKFGIFGDTMNTASRMESTCTPGRIQVSGFTHALLMASGASCKDEWEAMGELEIKGKGLMQTFQWLEPETPDPSRRGRTCPEQGSQSQAPCHGFLHQSAKLLQILQHPEAQEAGRLSMRRPSMLLLTLTGQLEHAHDRESLKLMRKTPTAASLSSSGHQAKIGRLRSMSHLRLQPLSMPLSKLFESTLHQQAQQAALTSGQVPVSRRGSNLP